METVDAVVPISSEKFQEGEERTALEDRVRQFLFENSDQAFTVYEIGEELDFIASSPAAQRDHPPNMATVSVQVVLLRLFDNGVVESRIINDGDTPIRYYRARK